MAVNIYKTKDVEIEHYDSFDTFGISVFGDGYTILTREEMIKIYNAIGKELGKT